MPERRVSIEELRELVAKLDPELLVATREVDRTLIDAALARSPLQRVEFARELMAALLSFSPVVALED